VSDSLLLSSDKDAQIASLQALLAERDASLAEAKAELLHRDLLIERKQQLNIRGMLRPAPARAARAAAADAVRGVIGDVAAAERPGDVWIRNGPKRLPSWNWRSKSLKPQPLWRRRHRLPLSPNDPRRCGRCPTIFPARMWSLNRPAAHAPAPIAVASCASWVMTAPSSLTSLQFNGASCAPSTRPKYSCRVCDKIVQAPAPVKAIARGKATFATLAHVIVAKFDHHLPLYRQSEMMAKGTSRLRRTDRAAGMSPEVAQGVDIDRSTLAGWTGQASALLDPIISRIREEGLKATKIHADDSEENGRSGGSFVRRGVPVLDPGRGKTATGKLWTYVVDDRGTVSNFVCGRA
jgi:transposase